MSQEDLDLGEAMEDRREQRRRALGDVRPRCSEPGCDEVDPLALTGVAPEIFCYEHEAVRKNRPWSEGHHLAGRRNDEETVGVPGNDHRILSELQNVRWARDTLRNPDASPLLRAAAALRGWLDVLTLIVTRTAGWVPPFLEQLDAWLREQIGPRWWDEFRGVAG